MKHQRHALKFYLQESVSFADGSEVAYVTKCCSERVKMLCNLTYQQIFPFTFILDLNTHTYRHAVIDFSSLHRLVSKYLTENCRLQIFMNIGKSNFYIIRNYTKTSTLQSLITQLRDRSMQVCTGSGWDIKFPHSSPQSVVFCTCTQNSTDITPIFWCYCADLVQQQDSPQPHPLLPQQVGVGEE